MSAYDVHQSLNKVLGLEENIFLAYVLAVLYLLLGLVALVQLIRIQLRLPEYGWTTQKVFHLLNVVCLFARAILFCVFDTEWTVNYADPPEKPLFYYFSFVFPGQIYFTTYTLLILFWAEIYHQARSLPLKHLRPVFFSINGVVYFVPMFISILQTIEQDNEAMRPILKYAMVVVMSINSLVAAIGFGFYGGRLYTMLRRFPLESKGRRKKLQEVGIVSGVATVSFVLKSGLGAFLGLYPSDSNNKVRFLAFLCLEIIPVAVILFVLRKLPPKRTTDGYHAIR